MATKDAAALRKRAQIAKANRMMFIWVACASVIVSASVVLVIIMAQRGVHNQKAINELGKTVDTLKKNNANVEQLKSQILALGSDESLLRLRMNDTDSALRVILDALPAEPNPSALGASLQAKLFGNIKVESVQVMPLSEGSSSEDSADAISFQFTVKGSATQLKGLLTRLERSIRTIQVAHMKLETTGGEQSLTVSGRAYYSPAKKLELTDKSIKR